MAGENGARRWLVRVGAVAVVICAVVVFVSVRQSGELQRSETCDDVEPGGTKLRSVAPAPAPAGAEPAPAQDPAAVAAAFRPESAEVVYCKDLADPYVLTIDRPIGHRLLVYGTQTVDANVPVLISRSILQGEEVGDALPKLPGWSAPGGVWAPSVIRLDDTYVLYYSTTDRASGRQCISVATSDDPEGPFVDRSTRALVCPTDLGGAIDPSPFKASDGTTHVLWKNDGNCCGIPTRIFSQPLRPDGLAMVGPPRQLLAASQPWEAGVVEAPAMLERDGAYFLFYSGNIWNTADYAVGYAQCNGPAGPCNKPLDGPWLASTEGAAGPGGLELFEDGDGRRRAVFHAWAGAVGYGDGGARNLFSVGIDVVDGTPVTAA